VGNLRKPKEENKLALKDIFHLLKTNYNSRVDDIVSDLYSPCLNNSNKYYRGTAYFRSSVLNLYKQEILNFCERGGKISILTSTEVDAEDAELILEGYSLRDFEKNLENMINDKKYQKATRFICTLIASKRLDIFIVKEPAGVLYHDKVGFFEDDNKDIVAFSGSGNETTSGVASNRNFERYTCNWSGLSDFALYGKIWSDELRNGIDKQDYADAVIYRFDELSEYFIKKYSISKSFEEFDLNQNHKFNYFNYDLLSKNGPQEHQLDAFEGWIKNNCHGMFEHATGTYKTASGLLCADNYLGESQCVVISAPLKIIAENWYNLVTKCFDKEISVIRCWSDAVRWDERGLDLINQGRKVIFIFVNRSLWSIRGIDFLRILKNKFLLVADEAHNWQTRGSMPFIDTFKPQAKLALTAKLSEPGFENDTKHILDYFALSETLFVHSLSLEKAIDMGFLRKYNYQLEIITPTNMSAGTNHRQKEKMQWNHFQEQKRRAASNVAVECLNTKSRVLGYTGPKIDHAIQMQEEMQRIWNSTNNEPTIFKKITGKEGPKSRKQILDNFNQGLTRSLIAIKVLDEGVDLPVSDAAVLAISNEKYRQWVQRRGRILRKNGEEDKSIALVVDFILDISKLDVEVSSIMREKHNSEILRIIEFSKSSINGDFAAVSKLEECGW